MLLLEVGVDALAVAVSEGDDDVLNVFLLYSNARNFAAAKESSLGVSGTKDFLLGGMTSCAFSDQKSSQQCEMKWSGLNACTYGRLFAYFSLLSNITTIQQLFPDSRTHPSPRDTSTYESPMYYK